LNKFCHLLTQPRNGIGPTVNIYHVITIQPVYWRVDRIYRKHSFLYCCMLGRVYRAVAWQRVDEICYNFIGDYLVGPYVLPRRLTDNHYRDFLQNGLLHNARRCASSDRRMGVVHAWWHNHVVWDILNSSYHNREAEREERTASSTRSPDLNPLDVYLWGNLKSLAYSTPAHKIETLHQHTVNESQTLRNCLGVSECVRQSMIRRDRTRIKFHGGHFEHFL
jgi:hypothetical protein